MRAKNTCVAIHLNRQPKTPSLKPQREIFDYALRVTGAQVEESLMIGDSVEVDIAGAQGAGMDQVHVNYNDVPQELTPTYTVRQLRELKEFL